MPDVSKDHNALIFRGDESFFLDSLTLKKKSVTIFETAGTTNPTTQHHIPEHWNLHVNSMLSTLFNVQNIYIYKIAQSNTSFFLSTYN